MNKSEVNNQSKPLRDDAVLSTALQHGIECKKVEHVGGGYLHGSEDDTPYLVDGVKYCGRCHRGL